MEQCGHRDKSDEVLGQLHVTPCKQDDGSCARGRSFSGPFGWLPYADLALLYPEIKKFKVIKILHTLLKYVHHRLSDHLYVIKFISTTQERS